MISAIDIYIQKREAVTSPIVMSYSGVTSRTSCLVEVSGAWFPCLCSGMRCLKLPSLDRGMGRLMSVIRLQKTLIFELLSLLVEQLSGSQLLLPPGMHLAMSGDIFSFHNGEYATGI